MILYTLYLVSSNVDVLPYHGTSVKVRKQHQYITNYRLYLDCSSFFHKCLLSVPGSHPKHYIVFSHQVSLGSPGL